MLLYLKCLKYNFQLNEFIVFLQYVVKNSPRVYNISLFISLFHYFVNYVLNTYLLVFTEVGIILEEKNISLTGIDRRPTVHQTDNYTNGLRLLALFFHEDAIDEQASKATDPYVINMRMLYLSI